MISQQVWDRSLDANPLDHNQRCIYADWLDEQGREDEADRQRKYVDAFNFLADFSRAYYDSWEHDDDGERIPGTQTVNYKEILAEIEYWAETGTSDNGPSFGTTSAQSELHNNKDTREEFWQCVFIVTGIMASDEVKEQDWYHCAC